LPESSALTARLNATAAVAGLDAPTEKCVTGTAMEMTLLVPAIVEFATSATVMVWLPLIRSVAWKMPKPLVSVALAGRVAAPSVLLKCTVPV
jgi:hypothetical protein